MTATEPGGGEESSPPTRDFYVLWCRVCDPDLEYDIPFDSPEARGRWAAAHTEGLGHDSWRTEDLLGVPVAPNEPASDG